MYMLIGYWILVNDYWLLAIGYCLLVIGYGLGVVGYWSLVLGYLLLCISLLFSDYLQIILLYFCLFWYLFVYGALWTPILI